MKNFNYLLLVLAAFFSLFSCKQDSLPEKEMEVHVLEQKLISVIEQNVKLVQAGKILTEIDFQNLASIEQRYLKAIAQKELITKDKHNDNRSRFDGPRRYFRAEHFYTAQDLDDPRLGFTDNCDDANFPFTNVQKGEGNVYRLGAFSAEITFCVKPPAQGETEIQYKDGQGTFFMEDGHELYFEIPQGAVKLILEPGPYQARFNDYFYFTGGTGPYENADGYGITNSFVKFLPQGGDRTDHTWYGWLLLE